MARSSLTYIPGFSADFILKLQWTIEDISIFSNSSHLEWRAGLLDRIWKETHPGTIPARLGLIWFHCCFTISQNELKFNCSYIPMSSLKYIMGFSVKCFFEPIYTDYAN
jgi:hypothetical protein